MATVTFPSTTLHTSVGMVTSGLTDEKILGSTLTVTFTGPDSIGSNQKTFPPVVFNFGVTVGALMQNSDLIRTANYRVVITDMGGTPLAQLESAIPGQCQLNVNDLDNFEFTMQMNDPKVSWVHPYRNEVQFWRGNKLLFWGPIVRVTNNQTELKAQCQDTAVYFTRRMFGPVPKINLLPHYERNGNTGIVGGRSWDYVSLPRSSPRNPPAHTVSWDYRYDEHHSMLLSSSTGKTSVTVANGQMFNGDTLTTFGKAKIRKVINDILGDYPILSVVVDGSQAKANAIADYALNYSPNATIRADGRSNGSNNTVFTYRDEDGKKGHKQCARQFFRVKNPDPSERQRHYTFTGYAMIINAAGFAANFSAMELVRYDIKHHHPDPKWRKEGYKKPAQLAREVFMKKTPHGVWIRFQTQVLLPNDGKESIIEARLFPTNGDVAWSELWLTYDDSLFFREVEQAKIVRAIVQHAQDESLGKSDLNIDMNVKRTGVTRSREYVYDDRGNIYDALAEFSTLGNGMEWDIVITPTTRTLTTYGPTISGSFGDHRMGRDTDVFLASNANVTQYTNDVDGTLMSSTVVVQAYGDMDNHNREERTASDTTLTDGLVLEKVFGVTPNSPAASWQRQADRGLARYRRPIKTPTLTIHPKYTSDLLDRVWKGDRVFANLSDNWETSVQKYRVNQIIIDPAQDTLAYTVFPEDIGQVVLNRWGANGWKYKATSQSVNKPTESNKSYADPSFDDSSWSTGQGGIGWVKDATGVIQRLPKQTPNTTVAKGTEVWARKHVKVTGDMLLNIQAADWAWVYVNGHLVNGDFIPGYNVAGQLTKAHWAIPADWLNENGDQVVAIHCQYDPDRHDGPLLDSVYADVQVVGTYDSRLVL